MIHFKVNYWNPCMTVLVYLFALYFFFFFFFNVSYVFVVSPLFQYSAVLAWNFRIFLNYSNKTTKKTCLPSSKQLLLLLFRPLSLDSSEITCSCKYWPNLFFCNPFDDGRHWTDNWGEIVIKTNKFMLYLRCAV